jgi:hypothetical protein
MADTSQFTIGTEASCSDEAVGRVSRLIVDPLAEKVTHLVVEPEHSETPAGSSLSTSSTVRQARSGSAALRLSSRSSAPRRRLSSYRSASGYEGFGRGPGLVGYWPYYRLGGGTLAQVVTRDTVPLGEVDVRRGHYVNATGGDSGRVQVLVIDPSRHVTHVLIQEGHLWGRKEVAIRVDAVASASDGIQLTIAKHQVQDLKPVDIDHPDLT